MVTIAPSEKQGANMGDGNTIAPSEKQGAIVRKQRLAPAQRRTIQKLYDPHVRGWGYKALAARFGVSPNTIKNIVKKGEKR